MQKRANKDIKENIKESQIKLKKFSQPQPNQLDMKTVEEYHKKQQKFQSKQIKRKANPNNDILGDIMVNTAGNIDDDFSFLEDPKYNQPYDY